MKSLARNALLYLIVAALLAVAGARWIIRKLIGTGGS
jgi:hypothetical protein